MSETKKKKLLYNQLKDRILVEYESKPYYSPLPGERELCDMYQVSRPTVRKALEILEEEGCIARFAGKGTFFVGNKKEETPLASNIAFYNQVRLRGDYTSSKVLTQKVEISDEEVAKALGIQKGELVFHLERLRYINGELWSLADAYVAYDICPELLQYDFAEISLHNTLSTYGYVPDRARRNIMAKKADEYEAFNLNLKKGDPLCFSKTVTYDGEGKPMEYSVSRSDVYKMSIQMTLQNKTNITEQDYYSNML